MCISITFHHDGIFTTSPLMYKKGDASTIRDIEFEGMTLIELLKKLKGASQFPVTGIYFLIPDKELSNGLVEIKDDSNIADCIVIAFKNEKLIKFYLEHHGYDLSHWAQTAIEDDEVSDVGEMEDISPYGTGTFINSDDKGVDTRYTVVDDVLYLEFDLSLPWNEMKPTLGLRFEHPEQLKECLTNYGVSNGYQLWYRRNDYQNLMVLFGRDTAEGRCGGKKGKKGDLPAKKEKVEGVQIESPSKGKGVQSLGKKGKGVHSPGKKGKGVHSHVGGSAMWPNTGNDPPLPPLQRKIPGRPRKLRIKHVTERDNEPQPKPIKEKIKPVRKKAGSSSVYPSHETGEAGPSTAVGSATAMYESGPTGVDESVPPGVDKSGVEVQIEAIVTEDLIQEFENEIPTQTSRTSMKEVVEASIAAGTLKLAGLKRRSK
nr:60S ribosomal protein L34 [Tanacetum cinerariifolium]